MTLEEIKKRLDASGGDCPCHSMVSCPDKAQEYWDHYDIDVEWLVERVELLEKVVEAHTNIRKRFTDSINSKPKDEG